MARSANVGPATFSPRQQIRAVTLSSPLTPANQVVATIARMIISGGVRRIFTVDFALGRYKSALSEAGLSKQRIASLIKFNLDHHDRINPGLTATEVALRSVSLLKGEYAVISDHVIDADNVCATFVALNPGMAKKHEAILRGAARFGDYYNEVSDAAMRIVLTIDAMRFGKNKFGQPYFLLTPEQQGEIFNEILEKMPQMLTRIELFKDLYEGELAKLDAARNRARADEGIIRPVSDHVAVIDEPAFPRSVAYQVSDRAIVISRKDLGNGSYTYNPVGLNPRVADYDLTGLWERLRNLENRERAKQGLPALEPNKNWGGRNVAGGSPKDESIGSILSLEQVTQEIEAYLFT